MTRYCTNLFNSARYLQAKKYRYLANLHCFRQTKSCLYSKRTTLRTELSRFYQKLKMYINLRSVEHLLRVSLGFNYKNIILCRFNRNVVYTATKNLLAFLSKFIFIDVVHSVHQEDDNM